MFQLLLSSVLLCASIAVTAQTVSWEPILAEYKTVTLNGIVQIGDSTLVGIGEFGTVARSTNLGKDAESFTFKPVLNGVSSLRSIAVSGSGNCVAVGNNGSVAISYDKGISWTVHNYSTETLKRIRFFGTVGIIIGENGVILQTKNDGVDWIKIPSGTTNNLNDLQFITSNTVTIVGDKGTLLHSTDSGSSWKQDTVLSTGNLWSICQDKNKMVISGENAGIYISSDAGKLWTKVISNQLPRQSYAMAMKGDTVIGIGYINEFTEGQYFSLNAGLTWTQVPKSFYLEDKYITITDKSEFLVCGGKSHISLIRKEDILSDTSGSGYIGLGTPLFLSFTQSFNSDVRSSSAKSFSLFNNEKILRTKDGGKSYDTTLFVPYDYSIPNVYLQAKQLFINSENELIVRSEMNTGKKYLSSVSILQGKDTNWKHPLVSDSIPYYKILDVNGRYACISTETNQMFVSSDGGKSWSERIVPPHIFNTSITASGVIWFLYYENNISYLGKTWVEKDSVTLSSYSKKPSKLIARDDAVYVYYTLYANGLYQEKIDASFDSGVSWKTIFSNLTASDSIVTGLSISKKNGTSVIAQTTVSGEFRFTSDNGGQWTTILLPIFTNTAAIDCADDTTFYVSSRTSLWRGILSPKITGMRNPILAPTPTSDVLVFPNPANESVKIIVNCQCDGVVSYRLIDNLGRIVSTLQGGLETEFSLNNLSAGTYTIAVYVNDVFHSTANIVKL